MIPEPIFSKARLQVPSFSLLLATLVAVLSLSMSAHASNIIADGGFEAAGGGNVYFAGQSIDGGSWSVTQGAVYIDTADPYVYAGNNSLNLTLANLYVPDTVQQALTTVVGQTYYVNFWGNSDSPDTFSLTENGAAVSGSPTSIADNGFPGLTTNSSLFTDYSGTFIATSTTTDLDLTATGDPALGSSDGSVMIDNVSVQPAPEPGSIVLLLTGAAGLGLLVARKRLGGDVLTS